MKFLYGLHDPGGEHLFADAKGWIVFTEGIGADPNDKSGRDYRPWSDLGYGVIVRLNHGYGSTGTIPHPAQYGNFAQRVANFIAASKGGERWIIGNEPNHSQERPQGAQIVPALYIDCFRQVYEQVMERAGTRNALMPAPVAPWNLQTGDWLEYHRSVWQALWQIAGGVALHTYTHGAAHSLITSEERVQGWHWHWHFRVYRDLLGAIPEGARGLPAYITEMNQGDNAWENANTQWVQAAYDEIDRWNQTPGTQKIFCGCLYRWPKLDKWSIEDKPGVQADLRAAVARRFAVPSGRAPREENNYMPYLSSGPEPATPPAQAPALPVREIDPRLKERGVTIETPAVQPGQRYWRVLRARWFSEQEAGGRHHIYVEALDENGAPTEMGFIVQWPGGAAHGRTNGRSGFDAGNFPMSASLNEFSVGIETSAPSEKVVGIGMGANGNPGIHTSTLVTFQLATAPAAQPKPNPLPVGIPDFTPPAQPVAVPPLLHPISDPALRIISQRFGENPQDYARFGMAGHTGIDFAVPTGTPVAAVDGGVVQEAGELDDYGLYVKLRHTWGESLYAHLSHIRVQHGEPVNRGHVIGRSGSTGNATGPHLHFAIRIYPYTRGAPYDGFSDPLPYLAAASAPAQPATTQDYVAMIKAAAQEFGVEWQLLASQAQAESSFDARAVSSAGAKGLLQLMPNTWAEWSPVVGGGDDPFNPRQNARVGARYLKEMLRMTGGNPYQALIAYGWGPGNWQSDLPRPELWVQYANKIVFGRDLLKAVGA